MKFELSAEERSFADALKALLRSSDVPSSCRAWGRGDHEPGLKLWKRLADLGVNALFVPEEAGGLEGSAVDMTVLFEQLGYFLVPGPYVESVVVAPLLLSHMREQDLREMGAGDRITTLAAPPWTPFALDADIADETLLIKNGALYRAELGGPLQSVDASRRLFSVTAGDQLGALEDRTIVQASNRAALACAAQLLGAGERLLERSVSYAKARTQFGKAIGEFQALKHAMTDVKIALDFARPLLYGAALAIDGGTSTVDRDVSAAKVTASDAAYLASRTALQMHGAIGYTAEYDLSLWIAKVRALVSAWGTPAVHRRRVWEQIQPGYGTLKWSHPRPDS